MKPKFKISDLFIKHSCEVLPEILRNVVHVVHVSLREIKQQNELLDGLQLFEVDHFLHFALGDHT